MERDDRGIFESLPGIRQEKLRNTMKGSMSTDGELWPEVLEINIEFVSFDSVDTQEEGVEVNVGPLIPRYHANTDRGFC
jgi:hypothetical protein